MPTVTNPRSWTSLDRRIDTLKNGSRTSTTSVDTRLWTNSVTYGNNIPGWRDKIRRGEDATTSLSGTKCVLRYKSGYVSVTRSSSGQPGTYLTTIRKEGNCQIDVDPPSGDPVTISSTTANNAALRKFNQKVLSVNTALQGGVVLGELRRTLMAIRRPASGLRKLVDVWLSRARALRSRYLRRRQLAIAGGRALGESWLEYSFGWRPLLADIDSACRALAEINTGQGLISNAVVAVGESLANASESKNGHAAGFLKWEDRTITKDHVIVVYRGAVRARVANPVLMSVELFGFQPSQFIPTFWELVPYSFLIDYFTNIGDILQGWASCRSNLSWCNRTIRKTFVKDSVARTWFEYAQAGTSSDLIAVDCSPASVVWEKTSVSRAKFNGAFTPGFEFEIPGLRSRKWLNIAALIASRSSDRSYSHGD